MPWRCVPQQSCPTHNRNSATAFLLDPSGILAISCFHGFWHNCVLAGLIFNWTTWMRGPRCRSTVAHLMGLIILIPPWARMSFVLWVSCVVQVEISANGSIPRPGRSYGVRCVWVWYRNFIEEDEAHWGCRSTKENIFL